MYIQQKLRTHVHSDVPIASTGSSRKMLCIDYDDDDDDNVASVWAQNHKN